MNGDTVRVLCIGDPHFKKKNVKDTDKMTESVIELIKTENPDFVVVLGDILDKHETIHESPLSRATLFLRKIQNLVKTFVLVGNHDMVNNSVFLTSENPFEAMKYWENITIVDVPVQENHRGHLFTFVPYVYPGRFMEAIDTLYGENKNPIDLKRLKALLSLFLSQKSRGAPGRWDGFLEEIEEIKNRILSDDFVKETKTPDYSLGAWEDSTCIFAHQEFRGCKMGAITSEIGDKWDLGNPLVVTGHIHDYDRLQDNITIVGTPLQHSFGDRSDKTVSLFTFKGDGSFSEERIDLKIPKKIMLSVKYDNIEDTEIPENCEVKVIIVGNTSQIKTATKLTKVKEWIKMGVKIAYRDVSEIDLEKQKPEEILRYDELLVKTLKSLPKEESVALLSLFRSVVSEI